MDLARGSKQCDRQEPEDSHGPYDIRFSISLVGAQLLQSECCVFVLVIVDGACSVV